jgi:molecular chaperone GrpE
MTGTGKRIPVNGKPAAADDSSAAAARAAAAPGAQSPPAGGGPTQDQALDLDQLLAELDAARQERDAAVDSELRLRAEWENFRRRAHRDATDARERAQGHLLTEMLPVLDNLERALDAAEHHDEGKVLGGVRMVRDLFVDLLRRSGVEEIPTVGAPFDPHVHEALVMQPSAQEEGTITAVLERGYKQGDRVLRPARVAVSSGPAEAGA